MKTTQADGLRSFRALEERIGQVLKVLDESGHKKQGLSQKLREAKNRIQQLESEVRGLQKNRKSLRTRVESILGVVAEMEGENLDSKKEKKVV